MGVEGVGSGPSTPSGITANNQLDDWTIALGGCLFRSKPRLVSIMIIMSMMLQVDRVGEHEETRHDSWDFVVIRNWRRHPSIKENQRRRLTPRAHLPEPHHHQGRPVNLTCHPPEHFLKYRLNKSSLHHVTHPTVQLSNNNRPDGRSTRS